jgi:hypothetical protein
MTSRLGFALVLAVAGCDASLGGGGTTDASVTDTGPVDVQMADAAPDAPRICTGGVHASAMAPDGSCLVHVTTPATYASAKITCTGISGGHLAYLKTAQLDTFAETFIGNLDTWIGGNDITTENTFLWEDGTPFVFTNWATGEPNNANNSFQEDCAIIAGARATKKWDDRPCDSSEVASSGTFAALCQY